MNTVRQRQKRRRIPFNNGRKGCLIDSRRSDWEEKVLEDNTRENMDEVESFVKKTTQIFFQNALRKEQEQFIERRPPS
jgi:hypothetical protein